MEGRKRLQHWDRKGEEIFVRSWKSFCSAFWRLLFEFSRLFPDLKETLSSRGDGIASLNVRTQIETDSNEISLLNESKHYEIISSIKKQILISINFLRDSTSKTRKTHKFHRMMKNFLINIIRWIWLRELWVKTTREAKPCLTWHSSFLILRTFNISHPLHCNSTQWKV